MNFANGMKRMATMTTSEKGGTIFTTTGEGKLLDLFTKFSFTDTDQMQKIKIIKPGLRFHKKDDKKKKKKE